MADHRTNGNDKVKAAKDEAAPRRAAFFRKHKDMLAVFGARIPSEQEAHMEAPYEPMDTVRQPKEIQASMRDYQARDSASDAFNLIVSQHNHI